MEAASVPRVTFNYRDSGAPADFKEAMALFDCDGSGFVDKQKLVNAANSQKKLKGQNAVLTKVVGTLVVLLCLFTAASFGLTLKALEMAKESQISGGQMTDKVTGELVQVASADMTVVDGKLVTRASSGLVTVAGSMPRVRSLEFGSSGTDLMTIDAIAVEEAISHYNEQGVGNFVVELPGQTGSVATNVEEVRMNAQGAMVATGFTAGRTRRWDLVCPTNPEAGHCEVLVTMIVDEQVDSRMLQLQARAGRSLAEDGMFLDFSGNNYFRMGYRKGERDIKAKCGTGDLTRGMEVKHCPDSPCEMKFSDKNCAMLARIEAEGLNGWELHR